MFFLYFVIIIIESYLLPFQEQWKSWRCPKQVGILIILHRTENFCRQWPLHLNCITEDCLVTAFVHNSIQSHCEHSKKGENGCKQRIISFMGSIGQDEELAWCSQQQVLRIFLSFRRTFLSLVQVKTNNIKVCIFFRNFKHVILTHDCMNPPNNLQILLYFSIPR